MKGSDHNSPTDVVRSSSAHGGQGSHGFAGSKPWEVAMTSQVFFRAKAVAMYTGTLLSVEPIPPMKRTLIHAVDKAINKLTKLQAGRRRLLL